MKAHSFFIKAVSALLGLLAVTAAAETRQSKVLLKNIQSLTLKKGLQTSHRRVEPVPQLKCIGGSGKPHYEVDVMRCTNSGSGYDSNDVEWTCKASLPPEFKLGSTDVICEGYSDSDDPYILKGSCGVEYRLLLTELGQQKYGSKKPAWRSTSPKSESSSGDYDYTQTDAVIMYLFWALFAGVALWMLYSFIKNYFAGNTGLPRNPVRFPGGGNGGDILLESPLAAIRRAGDLASGLEQWVVQRRVTRWDRVQTRTETRHIRRHRKGATAGSEEANSSKQGIMVGSEEVTRAKDLRAREDLLVQARHLVLPDTIALDLGQLGDAKIVDKYMTSNEDDNEFDIPEELIDSSDLSSTDSSSTNTPSERLLDSYSDLPALEPLEPGPTLPTLAPDLRAQSTQAQDTKAEDIYQPKNRNLKIRRLTTPELKIRKSPLIHMNAQHI
ncbi:hypothetical protein EG328_007631 [Venturia inaequalis]|uniref:Store-operated calcium entry-associated regulatory factor n=1 Tax=Venturia inaequalis TaxID=5025 RepID=A0A8H3UGM6_VENIN|nr:hypothetical protein EG328_007631 [Venturia inaequalis]